MIHMTSIDFDGINAAALRAGSSLLPDLIPGGKFRASEYVAKNPVRNDEHPGSFSINCRSGVWKDFASDDGGGDIVSLTAYVRGGSQGDAARELADKLGIPLLKPNGFAVGKTNGNPNGHAAIEPKAAPSEAAKVYHWGDEGPPKQADELRRHVYMSSNCPVRIKIKRSGSGYLNWYRVFADGVPIGWQAKKPDEYRAIPYVSTTIDPFDSELVSDDILWPEGEKDVDVLNRINLPAFTFGGVGDGLPDGIEPYLKDRHVVVLSDNDYPGRVHAGKKAVCAREAGAASIKIVHFPELPLKGDVSDFLSCGGTSDALLDRIDAAALWLPATEMPSTTNAHSNRLRPHDLNAFLKLSIKPRAMLLSPILPEKGLMMIYAARGTGKTHVALGIAYAIATGTTFLKWTAPTSRRVLIVDGEMPAAALQERLNGIISQGGDVNLDPDNIRILAGDLVEAGGIGNLASTDVQAELDPWLDGVDVLLLDNLSSLTAVIRDNDAESWGPIQEWLLRLRRRGISVVIVHHAGKGGQQRGTSRREDVLDTSISLRHPADYSPVEGARFEVHLERARGVHGDDARPFEAKLMGAIWTIRELDDANRARIAALLDDGLSIRDIADETGIPKSTVARIKKAIEAASGGDHAD